MTRSVQLIFSKSARARFYLFSTSSYLGVVLNKIPLFPLFNALFLIALMHYPFGGTAFVFLSANIILYHIIMKRGTMKLQKIIYII